MKFPKKQLYAFLERIEALPPTMVFLICLGIVFWVGLGDYLTGPELSSSIFYVIPVGLAAWCANARTGFVVSLVSAVAWLSMDDYSGSHYSHQGVLYWNALVRLGLFLIIASILSAFRTRLKNEERYADTDPLTGALNARAFYEQAEKEIARCLRYNHPLSLTYIDLDNFKQVNDKHGHTVGDALLRQVVSILHANTRKQDFVGRLGGDEFVALFAETDAPGALLATVKLQEVLLENMKKDNWPVTFSMGLVTYERPPEDLPAIVKTADDLMYEVKHGGKNRILAKSFPALPPGS